MELSQINKFSIYSNATTRTMDLYVFPEDGEAEGELFMDDGLSKGIFFVINPMYS